MNPWIAAARLRTLPLSISGILVAGGLAQWLGVFDTRIFGLAMATTLGFQILSNFANDYGDGVKGTDDANRVGPARAFQSGLLTASQLKKGMWLMSIFSATMAGLLIYLAFGKNDFWTAMVYAVLGIAAIIAAIRYTVGQTAYGYRGLGDLFVFLFFGLVGVCGAQYLFTREINSESILLSVTIGFLSMAVLNLNNMRDRSSDAGSGKLTLAVRLGGKGSLIYHFILVLTGIGTAVWAIVPDMSSGWDLLPLIAFVPLVPHLIRVGRYKDAGSLDPELKKVALSTFFFSLLLFVRAFIN